MIANYSNLTTSQFFAQMQASDLLLPLNNGVPQVVNMATGAPIPTSLTGLTNDPYRGLEYSILKNKNSKLFTTTVNITGAIGSAILASTRSPGSTRISSGPTPIGTPMAGSDCPICHRRHPARDPVESQRQQRDHLPNVGTVTVAQLPGFILKRTSFIGSTISNATLSTGTLDGNGGFTGITSFNLGTPSNPIIVGTPQSGLVMQLGNDSGFSVTLNGANTYTGGTTIIAGNLIIAGDAALGAAAPSSFTINPNNILASVQAANGIIFNSLTEGNGTLTLGTTAGNGTNTAGTLLDQPPDRGRRRNRHHQRQRLLRDPGGDDRLARHQRRRARQRHRRFDLTIDDNRQRQRQADSSGKRQQFGFLRQHHHRRYAGGFERCRARHHHRAGQQLGQIELNGGTFQAGASFSSERSLFLGGGSNYDTNGFTTSLPGTFTDVQRTLTSRTECERDRSRRRRHVRQSCRRRDDDHCGQCRNRHRRRQWHERHLRRRYQSHGDTDAGATANATVFINPAPAAISASAARTASKSFRAARRRR